MAYIIKRKHKNYSSYLVRIKRKGFKIIFKTFLQKSDAIKWARAMERKLDQGDFSDYSEATRVTLGDLFKRFISEGKHLSRKDERAYRFRVNTLGQDIIADTNLLRLSPKHIIEFKERRSRVVSPTTINKDLSFISVVIDTAIHDWGIYLPHNPLRLVKREREPNPRTRILDEDEYQRLLKACDQIKRIRHRKADMAIQLYFKSMVIFSVETGIRQGELLSAKYDDINMKNRTLLLRDTKNSRDHLLPLSAKALDILVKNPREGYDRIFPISRDSLKFWFNQVRRKAKLKDFRWHDMRRIFVSRAFEKGLSVAEVQASTNHKDPRVLLNTYTKLDPTKLAKKL